MKRMTVLLLEAILCLCLAACGKVPESKQSLQEPHTEVTDTAGTEEKQHNSELIGPWHLDSKKNDLAAFAGSLDLFPGFGEWGAGMEIRSNGQMNWYIGAEGWHGTYTIRDGEIHAQLTSDLEQSTQFWSFRFTEENGVAGLEMDYPNMQIYWIYGDREDIPAMGLPSKVYVDRQGTDEIYSSLSIAQSDNGYVIEMEGVFPGNRGRTPGYACLHR